MASLLSSPNVLLPRTGRGSMYNVRFHLCLLFIGKKHLIVQFRHIDHTVDGDSYPPTGAFMAAIFAAQALHRRSPHHPEEPRSFIFATIILAVISSGGIRRMILSANEGKRT